MSTQEKQDVCVHIRWMIRRDMAGVLEIEKLGFEFSWSEEDFVRCLRQRNCIGMVCEYEERVAGRGPTPFLPLHQTPQRWAGDEN